MRLNKNVSFLITVQNRLRVKQWRLTEGFGLAILHKERGQGL